MAALHSPTHNILDFSQPLQIAVFGLDKHTRNTLQKALRNSGKHCAILVNQTSAEAGVFDFDNSETSLCWASYRRVCPDLPTIVVGSTDPHLPDTLYISKPIRVSKLKAAIHNIKMGMPNHVEAYVPSASTDSHKPMFKPQVLPFKSKQALSTNNLVHATLATPNKAIGTETI